MSNSKVTLTLDASDYYLLTRAVDRYWADAHAQQDDELEQRLDTLAESLQEQKIANHMTTGA